MSLIKQSIQAWNEGRVTEAHRLLTEHAASSADWVKELVVLKPPPAYMKMIHIKTGPYGAPYASIEELKV